MAANVVFALTSGRSGTLFLCRLLRRNAADCTVEHEPYFQRGNPTMFGLPIYDHGAGNLEAIRPLLAQKAETIKQCRSGTYIETSHALLKSYWDIAPAFFPQLKLLHLIRHPLEVARSEANRELFIHRWHLPYRNYRGRDGQPYFRWALTGHEPIFSHFDLARLTLFQRYLVQWIEIENRAMMFLQRFEMQPRCLTIHVPHELNDPHLLGRLLDFLQLAPARQTAYAPGVQNRTPHTPTVLGAAELQQCRAVVAAMPERYLAIFRQEPYVSRDWSSLLRH